MRKLCKTVRIFMEIERIKNLRVTFWLRELNEQVLVLLQTPSHLLGKMAESETLNCVESDTTVDLILSMFVCV